MYALLTANPATPELFMPTGDTVLVPTEVIEQAGPSLELEYALRWALKAGLITNHDFLEAKETMGTQVIELEVECGA